MLSQAETSQIFTSQFFPLSTDFLQLLALGDLLMSRIVQFTIVQNLDLLSASQELQKHINVIKSLIEPIRSNLKQDTSKALSSLLNTYFADEKRKFASYISKHFDPNKHKLTSSPGDYYFQAAKHLLNHRENLLIVEESDIASVTNSSKYLLFKPEYAGKTSNDFLALEKQKLSELSQLIDKNLETAKKFFTKTDPTSRKTILTLLELALANPFPEKQIKQLYLLKSAFCNTTSIDIGYQTALLKISKALLKCEASSLETKTLASFELGLTKIFTKCLSELSHLKSLTEINLIPNFIRSGTFVAGFAKSDDQKSSLEVTLKPVSKIAKILLEYTKKTIFTVHSHRFGDFEIEGIEFQQYIDLNEKVKSADTLEISKIKIAVSENLINEFFLILNINLELI